MRMALVIGGSRFVGPLLVGQLAAAGYEVTLLNRQTRDEPPTHDGVRFLKGDRNDRGDLSRAAALRPDVVFDMCCYGRRQAVAAIDAFRGVRRYVWMSTVAVYQQPALFPIPETAILGEWPLWGSYGLNKGEAERAFRDAFLSTGFPVVAIRPSYVLGAGNYVEREAFYVSRLLRGIPVAIPGQGTALHSFAFVDDLAVALARFADAPDVDGEAFNMSSTEAVSQRAFVAICARALGVDARLCPFDPSRFGLATAPYDPGQASPFPDEHVVVSNEKLRRALGLVLPSFEEKLAAVVHAFAAHPDARAVRYRPAERAILEDAGYPLEAHA